MSISIRLELHSDNDTDLQGTWRVEHVPYTYMYPIDGDGEGGTFRRLVAETSRFEGEDDDGDQTTLYYGGGLADLAAELAGSVYDGVVPDPPEGFGERPVEISILY